MADRAQFQILNVRQDDLSGLDLEYRGSIRFSCSISSKNPPSPKPKQIDEKTANSGDANSEGQGYESAEHSL